MNTIQSIRITKTEGSSDKEYRLHLVEINGQYFVNYQNGRRGGTLTGGTKTKDPVSLEEAQKKFNQTLKEKLKDNYIIDGQASAPVAVVVKEKSSTQINLLEEVGGEIELTLLINNPNYVAQQKYDGERRSVNKTATKCVGGNKKNETVALPNEVIESLSAHNDIELDSEIIGSTIYVFDLLRFNKKDLKKKSLRERLEILSELSFGKNVVKAKTAFTKAEKEAMLKNLREENAEGIVLKEINAPYIAGRNSNSLKFKFYKTATVKVVSHTKGKRSVQMAVLDGTSWVEVGAVTVPSNKEIPEVNSFIEVRYLYAYKGGSLFQPTFLFKRNDVDETDAQICQLSYKQEEEVGA